MFSEPQVKALTSKLSAKYVRTRQHSGLTLSYIEGWHVIAEANRIFGYDAWDRQTMAVRCVWEGMKGNRSACSYIARVRVRVRAGDAEICREGCGSGHGVGLTPGEAHEFAIKEAETDAMKRALSTFGNPFGLALYDKEQQNVRGRRRRPQKLAQNGRDKPITWLVLSSEGEYISTHEDPVDYCKAMRQLLEAISTRDRLRAFWQRNLVILAMLKRNLPDLKTDKDEHYADILTGLYKQQMRLIWEEQQAYERRAQELKARKQAQSWLEIETLEVKETSQPAPGPGERRESRANTAANVKNVSPNDSQGSFQKRSEPGAHGSGTKQFPSAGTDGNHLQRPEDVHRKMASGTDASRIDKSRLPISTPRRIRDKDHLRYVASQACIVCGRAPAQAHHLRFAQPRALGRKVSDEWTVPLCSTHHRALHTAGDEETWWKEKGLDPTAHAKRLWLDARHGSSSSEGWRSFEITPNWNKQDGLPGRKHHK